MIEQIPIQILIIYRARSKPCIKHQIRTKSFGDLRLDCQVTLALGINESLNELLTSLCKYYNVPQGS